jgi:hypothetical protein
MFSLLGPRAAGLLERLGAADLPAAAPHAHAVFACAGARPTGPAAAGSAPPGQSFQPNPGFAMNSNGS